MPATTAPLVRWIPPTALFKHCPAPGPSNILPLSSGMDTPPSVSVIFIVEVGSVSMITCLVGVLQVAGATILPLRPSRLIIPPLGGRAVQAALIHASAVV